MNFRLLLFCCLCLPTACVELPLPEDPEAAALLDSLTVGVAAGNPDRTVLALNDEAKRQLDDRIDRSWGDIKRFRALGRYFFEPDGLNIQYDADLTGTATETWAERAGNCLAVSNLFVAAARHLDLDAKFQIVAAQPTWALEGNTMVRYEHIVVVGELAQGNYVVDFLPQVVAGEQVKNVIDDVQALALYYSNLGASALINGDAALAVDYVLRAIKLWPENSNSWNNLGTAYRRMGNVRLAELSYQRALKLDRSNYSALASLTHLYQAENLIEEADRYLKVVSRYYRRNPYYHYQLARVQAEAGDREGAKLHLERAARLKRDEPALLDALAQVYAALGDEATARDYSEQAERARRKAAVPRPSGVRFIRERPPQPW